jgi:hypothetical protein
MLRVAHESEPRVRRRTFRRSGRVLTALGVATFLAVNLINPILIAYREAAGWASSEFEHQAGRLPYIPRQSWSPSQESRIESGLRKAEPPRERSVPSSVLVLAAQSAAERFHPDGHPPILVPLTRPAYLHPNLDSAPLSGLPPPL